MKSKSKKPILPTTVGSTKVQWEEKIERASILRWLLIVSYLVNALATMATVINISIPGVVAMLLAWFFTFRTHWQIIHALLHSYTLEAFTPHSKIRLEMLRPKPRKHLDFFQWEFDFGSENHHECMVEGQNARASTFPTDLYSSFHPAGALTGLFEAKEMEEIFLQRFNYFVDRQA